MVSDKLESPQVILIVGPTASGKTEYSLKLAKKLKGEIISADSMQAYVGMDIGTSKPSLKQMQTVPHHLINILKPNEEYSAALFREEAGRAIEDIIKRKKQPIIVGGSGLYIKALVDGIFEGPSADWKLRRRLQKEAERYGNEFLYERLKKLDPKAALKIASQNTRRIIRALEVIEKTKKLFSQLKLKTKGIASKYAIKMIGLAMPREKLYKRIDERADRMFEDGLVKEVKGILKKYSPLSRTASQALGYKEVIGYLNNLHTLEEAIRLTKRNTRHFAKRQLTWFRNDPRVRWYPAS